MRHIVIIMSQNNRVINAYNPLRPLFTQIKESKNEESNKTKIQNADRGRTTEIILIIYNDHYSIE